MQTPVPLSTNSKCPEPQPHFGEVFKRPHAPVRIIDAAGAPIRSLQPFSAPSRDLSSNAAVNQVDVVHCYVMSVHARASANRDETLVRVTDHYSQSALGRVQSILAAVRARVSDQQATSAPNVTRAFELRVRRFTTVIVVEEFAYWLLDDPLFTNNKLSTSLSGAHLCPQLHNGNSSLSPLAVNSDTRLPNVLFGSPSVLPGLQHLHRSPITGLQCADSHAP